MMGCSEKWSEVAKRHQPPKQKRKKEKEEEPPAALGPNEKQGSAPPTAPPPYPTTSAPVPLYPQIPQMVSQGRRDYGPDGMMDEVIEMVAAWHQQIKHTQGHAAPSAPDGRADEPQHGFRGREGREADLREEITNQKYGSMSSRLLHHLFDSSGSKDNDRREGNIKTVGSCRSTIYGG